MIGGNSAPNSTLKELFIRWTQLTAFLPAMQFSVQPWYFGAETDSICRRYVDIHETIVFPVMKALADRQQDDNNNNNNTNYEPLLLVRPMWWLEPSNRLSMNMSDQFLVGDNDILVAPVLDEGATSRDIYIPSGTWHDSNGGKIYTGPTYLRDYAVTLADIPYFYSDSYYKKNKMTMVHL